MLYRHACESRQGLTDLTHGDGSNVRTARKHPPSAPLSDERPSAGGRSRPRIHVEVRKPNIKSLVRREDVDGLLKAATYRELTSGSAGTVHDLGIPVRADAILALGTLAPERGRQAITAALGDPADHVRCVAVRVLHALREVDVLAEVARVLPGQGESRTLALQAIFDLRESVRPSPVVAALVFRVDDDPLDEQDVQLILALLEAARPEVMDEVLGVLLPALGDERGIVVERAAEMLERLAPESIDALVDELSTGSNATEAAYVLGRIGDPRTLAPLLKALRHTDAQVRGEAAAALADLQDAAAVEPLFRATRDSEHSVRTQAGAALNRMGTTAVASGVGALVQPMIEEAIRTEGAA